jgi:hypothetical protein
MKPVAAAARRLVASRVAAWTVAGLAVVAALAAILLAGRAVSPDAASFDGLPQVGALFQGACRSEPHFCTASVVDSPRSLLAPQAAGRSAAGRA